MNLKQKKIVSYRYSLLSETEQYIRSRIGSLVLHMDSKQTSQLRL